VLNGHRVTGEIAAGNGAAAILIRRREITATMASSAQAAAS